VTPKEIALLKLKAENYLRKRKLNASQQKVAKRMLNYFVKLQEHKHKYNSKDLFPSMKNMEHVDAPMLLVTGDPGAGKVT